MSSINGRKKISNKRSRLTVFIPYILVIAASVVITLLIAGYRSDTQPTQQPMVTQADSGETEQVKTGSEAGDEAVQGDKDFTFSDNWYMDTRAKFVLDGVWHRMGSVGEILDTMKNIRHTSELSWFREWNKTAERVRSIGDDCMGKGHDISAGEAYLRAANYYLAAEVFLHTNPQDPRILETYRKGADYFLKGLKLFSVPVEEVQIPYEGITLKGYYFQSPTAAEKGPVILVHQGFDAPVEATKYVAEEAIRRGYHCLLFEGPGQGLTIREKGISFRPDWEKPVSAAIDYVLTRPEVDPDNIILEGISLGGGLAVRAAEYEPRIKICITNPGYVNIYDVFKNILTPTFMNLYEEDPKEFSDKFLELTRYDVGMRWGVNHGMWVFGGHTPVDFFDKLKQYDYENDLSKIKCKMLIMDGTGEKWGAGQAKKLYDSLDCPKEYMLFADEDSAEGHCQAGNPALSTQRMFDWLDENIK